MKKENKQAKKAPEKAFHCDYFEITRAYEFDGGNIAFDIRVNGIYIYGMTLIWMEEKGYYFVAFPSRKGKDGKYYNNAWFPVDDDLRKAIIAKVEEMLS